VAPSPTTADFLRFAAAAAADERVGWLEGAEGLAECASDWLGIAQAWLAAGDAAAALRCTGVSLQVADRDVHAWLGASRLRAALVGREAALDTLDAAAAMQASGSADVLHWRLLAEGCFEHGDVERAHRCLAAGARLARTADEFTTLARGHASLGEHDAARVMLERAEVLADVAAESRGQDAEDAHCSVAVAWHEIEPGLGQEQRVLGKGLAMARATRTCLGIAEAWAGLAMTPDTNDAEIASAHARAWQLAQHFEDFVALADAEGVDPADRRRALQRAVMLAATATERLRVAQAWRTCLGEEPPAGLHRTHFTPAELAAPRAGTCGWDHDAGALFDWLRERVSDEALATIADADYGHGRHAHLEALRAIRDEGRLPIPLPWHPREVLELVRWDRGIHVDHVRRAFCCVVLVIAELAEEGAAIGIADGLAPLLESCAELGHDAVAKARGLLAALADGETVRRGGEVAFALLGLLLAGLRCDAADERLEPLAARLLAVDAELVRQGQRVHPEHGFVLGATHMDQRVDMWRRLAIETLTPVRGDSARPALAAVAARFAGA